MRLLTLVLLCATVPAVEVLPPKPIILGNLGRYPVGHQSALEGGAQVARAAGAEAGWINPAGVADTAGAPASASASLYAFDRFSVSNANDTYQNWEAYIIPSAVGGAFAMPGTEDNVQVGVFLTQPALWASEVAFSRLDPQASGELSQAVSESSGRFEMIAPGLSLATMATESLAVGLSLVVNYVSYRQSISEMRRSVLITGEVEEVATTSLRRMGYYLVQPSFAVRGDLGAGFNAGVVLSAPGYQVYDFGRVDSTLLANQGPVTISSLHYDEDPNLTWSLPAGVRTGLAYYGEDWAVEVDLRWRASTGAHEVLTSDKPAYVVRRDRSTGENTITLLPGSLLSTANLQTDAPAALGGSLGGHAIITRQITLHCGGWYDPSPVRDGDDDLFTPMNIYGVSVGGTYSTDGTTTFSLGLLGTYGKANGVRIFPDPNDPYGGTAKVLGLQAALTTSFSL